VALIQELLTLWWLQGHWDLEGINSYLLIHPNLVEGRGVLMT
jgi:hypothetical protein